uniref:DUF4362 domain-containing protein n=1 Tax=Caenorhabditis tropicalis TaxID=1561998 RepID=A0A1I7U3V4_9PELO
MRSLLLLFALLGPGYCTIYWNDQSPKDLLQSQIDWIRQSINDRDEALYYKLVVRGSAADSYFHDQYNEQMYIRIDNALDWNGVINGIGEIEGQDGRLMVRMAMGQSAESRTGFQIFDWEVENTV